MGLVRRATAGDVVPGQGGSTDISTILRQAVEAEIERQRVEKRQESEPHDDSGEAGG